MSELTDDRLLPCPFCGAPAEHDSGHYDGQTQGPVRNHIGHAIYCSDINCIGCAAFSRIYETEDEAIAAWNRRAAASTSTEAVAEPEAWPDKEEGVAELVDSWRKYINDRPQLMSFLYDVDMLPEQIVSRRGAQSLDAVCCVFQAAENGQIPLNPTPPASKVTTDEAEEWE